MRRHIAQRCAILDEARRTPKVHDTCDPASCIMM